MNEIVNSLTGDKFMPEMNLKQPGFTYSACGPFKKKKRKKKGIQKYMQTRDTHHVCRNDMSKSCFQHDISYGSYKDWLKEQNLIKF